MVLIEVLIVVSMQQASKQTNFNDQAVSRVGLELLFSCASETLGFDTTLGYKWI